MADKRFSENPADVNPDGLDIIPGTDVSTGEDAKYTFDTIAAFVKTAIGNATISVAGLMSSADKTKADGYAVHNPGNNLYLTTNGSNVQVWVPILTALGDMLKSSYATADPNKVDTAIVADAITGSPGNNKSYITDGAGNQVFVDQSAVADMKKSDYATVDPNKVDTAIISDNTSRVLGNLAVNWTGQTVGATPLEIFTDGISAQLVLADDTAISATIEITGLQSDVTDAAYFTRQLVIANIAGTTALQGAVQTVGTDINPTAVGLPVFTADDTNEALKVEMVGKAAETWNWKVKTIINLL